MKVANPPILTASEIILAQSGAGEIEDSFTSFFSWPAPLAVLPGDRRASNGAGNGP